MSLGDDDPLSVRTSFTDRLRLATTGRPDASLVFIGNFEVEHQWAKGEVGLPRVDFAPSRAIVNRMDEFALLLGTANDHVLLKEAPDEGYVAYLRELGLSLPSTLAVTKQNPALSITEDALNDSSVLAALSRLASSGAYLMPHGVSPVEECLAERASMPLAAPPARTVKEVNSKIYSRKLADDLSIRQPPGWPCDDLGQLDEAVAGAAKIVEAGRPVAVKDAFGVSGKGIAVVKDRHRLQQVHRMIIRGANRAGVNHISVVVEEWLDNCTDINYQFTIGRDGQVHFDFVKGAITDNGVHRGHRIPAGLTSRQEAELRDCSVLIGRRLFADGYFGVVGVDGLVRGGDSLYPLVEINARNNMSTYQARLHERFIGDDKVALARVYELRLTERISFMSLRAQLGGLLFQSASRRGLLLNNFATLNAVIPSSGILPGPTVEGRVYGMVVADSWDEVAAIDENVTAALGAMSERGM